jgi:hypothetical protein
MVVAHVNRPKRQDLATCPKCREDVKREWVAGVERQLANAHAAVVSAEHRVADCAGRWALIEASEARMRLHVAVELWMGAMYDEAKVVERLAVAIGSEP